MNVKIARNGGPIMAYLVAFGWRVVRLSADGLTVVLLRKGVKV